MPSALGGLGSGANKWDCCSAARMTTFLLHSLQSCWNLCRTPVTRWWPSQVDPRDSSTAFEAPFGTPAIMNRDPLRSQLPFSPRTHRHLDLQVVPSTVHSHWIAWFIRPLMPLTRSNSPLCPRSIACSIGSWAPPIEFAWRGSDLVKWWQAAIVSLWDVTSHGCSYLLALPPTLHLLHDAALPHSATHICYCSAQAADSRSWKPSIHHGDQFVARPRLLNRFLQAAASTASRQAHWHFQRAFLS